MKSTNVKCHEIRLRDHFSPKKHLSEFKEPTVSFELSFQDAKAFLPIIHLNNGDNLPAIYIFELANVPQGITEISLSTKLGKLDGNARAIHESKLPEDIRPKILARTRLDGVSFFILSGWETYAVGNLIHLCIRKTHAFMERIRGKVSSQISCREIQMIHSKDTGLIAIALPYASWFLGLFAGSALLGIQYWFYLTVVYFLGAILIEGRERIYSRLLISYYNSRGW